MLATITDLFVETVYPSRCLACPSETATARGLCGSCWGRTHFFSGAVCDLCGVSVPTAHSDIERVICDGCDRKPPAWDRGCSAVAYEGVGRQIVMAFKHADRIDMAATLAKWMTAAGADMLSSDMLVVPVPLHWSRILRRRYNQSGILAKHVAHRIGADIDLLALKRTHATAPLNDVNWAERHEILSAAIAINPKSVTRVTGSHILLIDDVMTSGATLSACSEVCRAAGASRVSVLTLARVARRE